MKYRSSQSPGTNNENVFPVQGKSKRRCVGSGHSRDTLISTLRFSALP